MEAFQSMIESAKEKADLVTGTLSSQTEENNPFNLSLTKRIIGFVTFLGIGLFLCFVSTWLMFSPRQFAKFYTFGSLFVMISTFFVKSPIAQFNAIRKSRAKSIAFIIYLTSIILTLLMALKFKLTMMTVIFVFAQFGAVLWYGASFIPFAQSFMKSTAKTILPL